MRADQARDDEVLVGGLNDGAPVSMHAAGTAVDGRIKSALHTQGGLIMSRKQTMLSFALSVLAVGAFAIGTHAATIYVDASATGENDGSSWTNAFTDLQDGIDAAGDGDEVWVATVAGGYKPTHETSADPRSATFLIGELQDGLKIYGGFLGLAYGGGGETSLNQRNPETNVTMLSGDLDSDDGPGAFEDTDDNAYHVVTILDVGSSTILDGFRIEGGVAEYIFGSVPYFDARGGGLLCIEASPTIVRCTFTRNGAVYNGGAIMAIDTCNPTFVNCSFQGNVSLERGGGVALEFLGSATFVNCVFSNNVSLEVGGGIFGDEECTPLIVNCTFSGNYAEYAGGGAYLAPTYTGPQTQLRNVVVSGNIPDELASHEFDIGGSEYASIAYSDINGGVPQYFDDDGNNIDDDPLFVRNPDPGTDTYWATEDDDYGDLRLTSTSPCIDVGDNGSLPADFGDVNTNGNYAERTPRDLDVFRKRVLEWGGGFIVDMGAYEFGCNENLDASNDCEINGYDLAVLLGQWTGNNTYGNCPPYLQADLDEDCKINGADIDLLLDAYGKCSACGETESFGPQQEDPWYEQFMQWLAEEAWPSFLQWWAEHFS